MQSSRLTPILGAAACLWVVPLLASPQEPAAEASPETPVPATTGVLWNEMLVTRERIAVENDRENMEKVTEEAKHLITLSRQILESMEDRLELPQRVRVQRSLRLIPYVALRIAYEADRGIPGRVRDLLAELDHDLEFIRGRIPDKFLEDPPSTGAESSTAPSD